MPNTLIFEKSPYLLQHANNPVDWRPWGEEAFRRAREQDKPIFLSIGYATCHWCHVMERESFEDTEVARLLNEHFVPIKVDREERPDVDQIYMTVCQALTGRGGWPLSVFLTPAGKPFYAGTYFPKSSRLGLPGMMDILPQLAAMWSTERERVVEVGARIVEAIQPKSPRTEGAAVDLSLLEAGYRQLRTGFDDQRGGFGSAPKFPTPHHLTFLLRWHKRHPGSDAAVMVEKTLDAMRNGGIFDHLGFGFARYSVDERWFAPHFEKMLYDQSLLAIAYLEAYQALGKERFAEVARDIFTYVLRDMTDPSGGFYSAEDADSEGVEGLFYLWTPDQVKSVLGPDSGDLFCRFYDVHAGGNFEHGRSILHIGKPLEVFGRFAGIEVNELKSALEEGRQKLLAARARRVHPLKDDKILSAWNGLMISALAKGYQVLGEGCYLDAAKKAAGFVLEVLRDTSGRLHRRYRAGETAHPAYMDDYAFITGALLDLYESTFAVDYLEQALELNRVAVDLFWDQQEGGFFYTARDGESLIVRDKEIYDGAIPSSNSVAALNLFRLARMTGDAHLETMGERLLRHFAAAVADHPSAYTSFLHAVDFALGPSREVVIVGDLGQTATRAMVTACYRHYSPNRVLMLKPSGSDSRRPAALAGRLEELKAVDSQPTAYICENFACGLPVTDLGELRARLG